MAEKQPDLVFIITDQQRLDTINALGHAYVDTPNIDRLVHEGASFTNCHVNAPSCAPARASLFTGLHPHTTGIHRNGDTWRHSWIERLAASGYYCVNVGKMHTQPYETEMGFDERYVVENKDRYLSDRYYFDRWDLALRSRNVEKQQRERYREREDYEDCMGAFRWEEPADLQADVFVGGLAEWWIETKPKPEGPTFLQIGFPGPHPPYDPLPEYAEKYLGRDIPLPEIRESDLAGQPKPLRALRAHNAEVDHDSVVHRLDPTEEQLHRQRAFYMANVAMIDEQVGRIMDALEENGYLDNGIVVFTSDHGDALNDHGHVQKWTMYDSVVRVPTIVWGGEGTDVVAGQVRDELCQLFDLGPTILDLADVEVPSWMQAESLAPALHGEEWEGRDAVFSEQRRDGILQETEYMSMVRTADWKLVHFVDHEEGQLFDLENDPAERENLWDHPDVRGKKRELLDRLRDWRIRSQVRAETWAEGSR